MPIAKLRIINSELSGTEFVLPEHPVVIGRTSDNDIVIPDRSVSRQHVRAEFQKGLCVLTDLGSHNKILIGDREVQEAALSNGDRFELGDVALEFLVEAPAEPAQPPPPPETEVEPAAPAAPYAVAPAEAVPAANEQPVYVDDVFGPAGEPAAPGPGEEEKAAVAGARGAVIYFALLVVILVGGYVAWVAAGRQVREEVVKPVLVRVGERKVVDLGIRTREQDDRLVTYIDPRDVYQAYEVVSGQDVAAFELDQGSGFIATIEGLTPGEMDVRVVGPSARATVRILVRGKVPPPPPEPRMTREERIRTARKLIQDGEAAWDSDYIYRAMQKFKRARKLLEPVRGRGVTALSRQADQRYSQARIELDNRFQAIKLKALGHFRDGDPLGAAKALEQLRRLVPDEEDEMHQKLKIIFDRTVQQIR
jgi:hypothetical protein